MSEHACQQETIAFLSDPQSYCPVPESVHCIQTHGALVFLAGDDVLKIKRAVKYPYMDFSTLELRESACRRELAINQPCAPQIYREVVPVVRVAGGGLMIGGTGQVVEWAVHMRRFDQDSLLGDYARDRRLTDPLAHDVARAVVAFHRSLVPAKGLDYAQQMAKVVTGLGEFLASPQATSVLSGSARLRALLDGEFASVGAILELRGNQGFVVRGHGDLHLDNIAVIDDSPVLFDALEFDEELATVDVLYDLAFLLMDLEFAGLRDKANLILNRYLFDSARLENYSGLQAMPLFLGLRASVRGMVGLQRSQLQCGAAQADAVDLGKRYLRHATTSLQPADAELIAIGGLSGTGKSTQARAIAADIGAAPGAVHLRSDQERKLLSGVRETDRLPPESYSDATGQQVYVTMFAKANLALRAGHSAVVDATFLEQAQRNAAQELARVCGVRFRGVWLCAPPELLHARVAARRNDASDATEQVVDTQLTRDIGPNNWLRVDAGGNVKQTLANVRRILLLSDRVDPAI